MNWFDLLNDFDYALLEWMGEGSPDIQRNVITERMINDPYFVQQATNRFARLVNMTSLSRLATICQMIVFDHVQGPENDGKRKALRRHWYQWYKTRFAIPYSSQFENEQDIQESRWGLNWMGRLSQTYANLVDNEGVTYHDLWVEDGSRMIDTYYEQLFRDANIIVCVEKDSLFPDFKEPAQRIGARVLISGKGKPSKAAAEKMLRDAFDWPDGRFAGYDRWGVARYKSRISAERPLIVMSISDHDYDGEQVIGPSFAEQLRTYTPHIKEVRVGIRPSDAHNKGYDLQDIAYQIKIKNAGYIEWAIDKAFFDVTCESCGELVFVESAHPDTQCPHCFDSVGSVYAEPDVNTSTIAYGFEVEAMRTRDYYALLVDALLRVVDFDFIVERLRIETTADDTLAAEHVVDAALADNESYQQLRDEIERLQNIADEIRYDAISSVSPYAQEHNADFWEMGDDPEISDFSDHVESRYGYGAWSPFDVQERTEALEELMNEELEPEIDELRNREIDWRNSDDSDA